MRTIKQKELISYKGECQCVQLESNIFNLNIKTNSLIDNYTWWFHEDTNEKYPLRCYQEPREIKYIVLHYTATFSEPKNGLAERLPKAWNISWNNKPRYEASADFGVDEETIVQYNPNIEYYHCFSTSNNSDKISIEMCTTYTSLGTTQMPHEIKPNAEQWSFSEKVLDNTKKLIIELFNKYGELEIITHFDVPLKNGWQKPCPGIWGWNTAQKYDRDGNPCGMNDTSELDKFKNEVKELWEKVKNR
jgi:hypothetical protein